MREKKKSHHTLQHTRIAKCFFPCPFVEQLVLKQDILSNKTKKKMLVDKNSRHVRAEQARLKKKKKNENSKYYFVIERFFLYKIVNSNALNYL